MEEVTKENILKFIKLKKQYLAELEENKKNAKLLKKINNFINNVINKDKEYYSKISSYNLTEEEIRYLL